MSKQVIIKNKNTITEKTHHSENRVNIETYLIRLAKVNGIVEWSYYSNAVLSLKKGQKYETVETKEKFRINRTNAVELLEKMNTEKPTENLFNYVRNTAVKNTEK